MPCLLIFYQYEIWTKNQDVQWYNVRDTVLKEFACGEKQMMENKNRLAFKTVITLRHLSDTYP